MTTMPTVTAASLANAANTGNARSEDDASTGNAFAALMRSVGSRFTAGAIQPNETAVLREPAPRPEPKVTEARDPAPQSDKNDDKVDQTAARNDAARDKQADKDAKADDDAADAAAANAQPTVDPSQSAQLAAIQVQLMNLTAAAAPVAVVAPTAVTTTPDVVVTAPVAADATAAAQDTTATPTAAAQTTQVQQQAVATAAAATEAATPTQTTVATPAAAAAASVKSDAAAAVTDTPQQTAAAETTTTTTTAKTPGAQAQSESLSRLLGDDNAIRVAVTVEAPKAATPSINPYNHFVGYSAGDNAALSNANGQAGQAQASNALVADPAATDNDNAAPTIAQAATATAQANGTATTVVRSDASVTPTGITGVTAASGAGASQSDLGQTGLGQSGFGPNGAPAGTTATSASTGTDSSRPAATTSQIFDQIKVNITRATKAGHDQVSIQLRPDDLGRIDVKLEVEQDGKVRATVVADNAETLKLMQNDARGLERALTDAGLRTDTSMLEFSLRGDSDAKQTADSDRGTSGGNAAASTAVTEDLDPTYDYSRAALQRGGVDTYA